MSDSGKRPSKEQQNKNLQQNFFNKGTSNFSVNMGRPSGPSANIQFFRQAHDPVRDHNPSDKMNNWFPKEKFPPGSRALSWMTENSKKANPDLDFSITDDFWESDFSDEFISKIMNDASQETPVQLSGKPQATSSTSSTSTSNSLFANNSSINTSKLGEKFGIKSSLPSTSRPTPMTQTKGLTRNSSFSGMETSSSSDKNEILIGGLSSQRKMLTQSRSFNLSSNPGQSRTTEWLRSQLEKVNKECKSLKESISAKDGETKILRTKLCEAKSTIEKQKMEKEIECLQVKATLEERIEALKKELKNAQTQMLFKSKEAESNIERYKELKRVNFVEPQFSQATSLSQSFRKFTSRSEKPKLFPDASESFFPGLSQKPTSIETGTKSVQTEVISNMEIDTVPVGKKRLEFSLERLLNNKSTRNFGNELSEIILPSILEKAKLQHSVVIPEEMEYVSLETLYQDSSEIPPIDYDDSAVRENLFKLWGEDSTGLKRRPNQTIRESCYFTSLSVVRPLILRLCELPKWNDPNLSKQIIEHVTKMARELFVAFRDKAVIKKFLYDPPRKGPTPCWDENELDSNTSMFSASPWNEEAYVDLRRGVSLIAAICQIDLRVRRTVLEQSRFIIHDSRRVVNTFTPEELNFITCITDTFTDGHNHHTTYNHQMTPKIISDRVKNIQEMLKSREGYPFLSNKIEKHLPTKDEIIKELKKTTSKSLKDLKKLTESENPSSSLLDPKQKINEERSKKRMELLPILNSNPLEKIKSGELSITSRVDVLRVLDRNDIISYIRHQSDMTTEVPQKLLENCTSKIEKELLCSSFKTFLQIKGNMESSESSIGVDLLAKSDDTLNIQDVTNFRKRKIPSDHPEPSTSKYPPDTLVRKRDLAPLKKPRKGNELDDEMDTQEIQDELEIIFQDETKFKKSETKRHLDKDDEIVIDLTGMNTPVNNESILVYKNEDAPLYEYLYPEEIASQCELLEILLEIIRSIGCLGFTARFNGLLAATATLLISLTKFSSVSHQIRLQYVGALILEMVYCCPSSRVLLLIHQLLRNCVTIDGFNKIFCRNANPDKFVRKMNQVIFKRGACLLSMMCMYSEIYVPEKHWDIQETFIDWVGHLFLVDNSTVIHLYRNQRTTCGQCSCAESLNSAVIRILAKAVGVYHDFCKRNELSSLLDLQLVKIIKFGLKILFNMVNLDSFFKQNINRLYVNYISFVESTKYLHESKDFNFSLCPDDLPKLNLLIDKIDTKLQKKTCMSDEFKLKFLCFS